LKSLQSPLICIFLLSSITFWGQEENHLFLFNGQSQWTNPSNVGFAEGSSLELLVDSQWLGIKDAPKQQSLLFNFLEDHRKLKLGGILRNRTRFGEQNIQFLAQSAFPIPLNSNTVVYLGFQILGDFFSSEYEYLRSVDGVQNDLLLQQQRRFVPNAGIGFVITNKNLWVKGSIPRLLDQYSIGENPTVFLRDQLHFFSEIGIQVPTNNTLHSYKINALVHNLAYDQLTVQLKGAVGFRIGELLAGINSSRNIGLGFQFNQSSVLNIGYFFQFPFLTSTGLNKTNHSLSLLFKFSSKNNDPL